MSHDTALWGRQLPDQAILSGGGSWKNCRTIFQHRPRVLAAQGTPEGFAVGAVDNPAGRPHSVVVLRGLVFVRFPALGEAFAIQGLLRPGLRQIPGVVIW